MTDRDVNNDDGGLIDDLMTAVALLSPAGSQRDILHSITAPDGSVAGRARVDRALGRLVALSLLVWAEASASVVVHRLVGRVVRERATTAGTLVPAINHAATALRRLLIPEQQAWAHRDRGAQLVAHIQELWRVALGTVAAPAKPAAVQVQLMNWAVRHLTVTADLSQATQVGAHILADCERVLGP